MNWIWFRVERETKLKALVSGGDIEIDGGWNDGCFFPIVIKGNGIEGDAAVGEPCVVVQDGVYATVLRDGDAGIWIDGEWKPGDSFLLPQVVTVVEGEVLGGLHHLLVWAVDGGSHNVGATMVVSRWGVGGAARWLMAARVSIKITLARLC